MEPKLEGDYIERKVEEFYSIFAGNKFEASYKKLKQNGEKVEPYFMEDWIRETLLSQRSQILEDVRDCIPDEKRMITFQDEIGDIRNIDRAIAFGFNSCREQLLNNLKEIV